MAEQTKLWYLQNFNLLSGMDEGDGEAFFDTSGDSGFNGHHEADGKRHSERSCSGGEDQVYASLLKGNVCRGGSGLVVLCPLADRSRGEILIKLFGTSVGDEKIEANRGQVIHPGGLFEL